MAKTYRLVFLVGHPALCRLTSISESDIIQKKRPNFLSRFFVLDYQDSNLDKQNQNLLCYHYTIIQTSSLWVSPKSDAKIERIL